MTVLLTLALRCEEDVVAARQRAREIAAALGFDSRDQVRVATAVSEIGRNAVTFAGGGKVQFHVDTKAPAPALVVRVSDEGPGIADLSAVLERRHETPSGLGLGVPGARRLMDECDIDSLPGKGTTQTYMSVTDPGEGHILGTSLDEDYMRGVIVHVEHLERANQDRSSIESYRIPAVLNVAKVRMHVGPRAPVTSSWISAATRSASPAQGQWSSPGSSTSLAPGRCSAR